MSIPLDRLYHYIEHIAEEIHGDRVIIYRFYPHGSKNIYDLNLLRPAQTWKNLVTLPPIYCNDQEPLNFYLYEDLPENTVYLTQHKLFSDKNGIQIPKLNFRKNALRCIWDSAVLLHSEQRSSQLDLYQTHNFFPVYYWSHGLISRDWFRFAEHVAIKKNVKQTFLIYNRAWGGTREYRLKFADLLVKFDLHNHCKTSISPVESELKIHYNLHRFKNPDWRPNYVLENYFPVSTAQSHYSADFDIEDYNSTDIEVVLETLFDDSRLHLTEKSLRPIACGQPFIVAGTHGSIDYLHSYGFKTFEHIWDESYDRIQDPKERLMCIADLMKQIANWDSSVRKNKMALAREIADYNKKYFFSEEFLNKIIAELQDNFKTAFHQLEETNRAVNFMTFSNLIKQTPELLEQARTLRSEQESQEVFNIAQKYYLRRLNNQK